VFFISNRRTFKECEIQIALRLKEEINEQESIIKKQEEQLVEEQKRTKEHTRRWEEAEKEVKELHLRLQMQATVSYGFAF